MLQTSNVHTLLHMSAEKYSEDYTERYMRWCIDKASDTESDLQKLLANSKISQWYNAEFMILEEKFIKMVEPQHNFINYKSARTIYSSITAEIFLRFPQPLIETARKLNINSN